MSITSSILQEEVIKIVDIVKTQPKLVNKRGVKLHIKRKKEDN